MQDQLRYDVVHDPQVCDTPAQDRLRREGTDLTRYYCPLGICSPSRASTLTGLYPHGHGVLNNFGGTDAIRRAMREDIPTVAELLSDAGYRTGYVGKWHLSFDGGPGDRGFQDVRYADRELGNDPRFADFWRRWRDATPDAVFTRYPPSHPAVAERHPRRPFPIYSTDTVPEEVIPATGVQEQTNALLAEYAGGNEPFLLMASFIEPHWPNLLPEPYAAMYDPDDLEPWPNFGDTFEGKPRAHEMNLLHFGVEDFTWDDWAPAVARYLGAVSFIDDLVGRILTQLDALGLADDTLVVSTTDHGDFTGSHRQFNKGPLMYEEVYHIPCTVRWPGQVPAGATVDGFANHVDLLPTILDAAGADPPQGLHGSSLLPLLRGDAPRWRDRLMAEFHGDEFGLYSQRMLREDRWKLVYNPNDLRELYDLEADPAELHNLAYDSDHLNLRLDLEAHLLEVMNETEDSLRLWAANTLG